MENKIENFTQRQKADSIYETLGELDFAMLYDLVFYGAVTEEEADKLKLMLEEALDNLFYKMQEFDNKNKR
jgi:hypothetical protein